MTFAAVLAIAVSLAMDAFTVSVSCGCASPGIKWSRSLLMAFFFGLFQFLMPLAGYLAGTMLSSLIESVSHIISFLLLSFVGGKMVYESINSEEGCREADYYFKSWNLVLLSVATSIDALAAGFTFAYMDTGILFPAALTGIITFILSLAGSHAGSRIGTLAGRHAETAGGIVLILLGLLILLRPLI